MHRSWLHYWKTFEAEIHRFTVHYKFMGHNEFTQIVEKTANKEKAMKILFHKQNHLLLYNDGSISLTCYITTFKCTKYSEQNLT